jgi:hypothetical protein
VFVFGGASQEPSKGADTLLLVTMPPRWIYDLSQRGLIKISVIIAFHGPPRIGIRLRGGDEQKQIRQATQQHHPMKKTLLVLALVAGFACFAQNAQAGLIVGLSLTSGICQLKMITNVHYKSYSIS